MANALPDLKLLRIFVSVVRHQGFANAQQELNLSTSAISTYMSQLEAALGLVLCHRGRGGFRPYHARASCSIRKPCVCWRNLKVSNNTPPPSKASCAAP